MSKSSEELRRLFLDAHKNWERVNNARGFASGEVHEKWEKRTEALIALVRANEKKRKP